MKTEYNQDKEKGGSLSLCMIVKNEEENLKKYLSCIIDIVDELIVIDTGSTDDTMKIAEEFGGKVYNSPWEGDFAKLKNEAGSYAKSEWLLIIDADEKVSKVLKDEIIQIIKDGSEFNGYYMPRKNYYLGKWLKFGGNYPDYQLKLFRRGKGVYHPPPLHPKVIIDGKIGYLKNPLEHFPYETVGEYLKKFELYTTYDALFLEMKNVKVNFINSVRWIVIKPSIRFIKRYFLKLGFLNGIPGLFACIFDALNYAVKYIKLWHIYENKKYG